MAVTIMQGDSRAIFLNLTQNGSPLTPDLIDDLEVSIGDILQFAFAEDRVKFDAGTSRWCIWPTQDETFSLDEGSYKVEIRVKYHNMNTTNVQGYTLNDKIKVKPALSREVL